MTSMADVRTLLRNERLARRITHPNAVYSASGTLSCNVCNLRLQADSLWEPHLAGKVHRQNLQRLQAAPGSVIQPSPATSTTTAIQTANGTSRKRKADDEDVEEVHVIGKKRRAVEDENEDVTKETTTSVTQILTSRSAVSGETSDTAMEMNTVSQQDQDVELGNGSAQNNQEQSASTTAIFTDPRVDDDEYAAFEAAIASAAADDESAQQPNVAALISGADIAAAPVSAAELAARQADDLNQQRRGKDAEIEGEKEDAARALEEEFDEMDQLEAKVRKLREMRERLRTTQQEKDTSEKPIAEDVPQVPATESDNDDDDDDDEYEDWGFR